jgi:hypothetical protein
VNRANCKHISNFIIKELKKAEAREEGQDVVFYATCLSRRPERMEENCTVKIRSKR